MIKILLFLSYHIIFLAVPGRLKPGAVFLCAKHAISRPFVQLSLHFKVENASTGKPIAS